MINADQLRNLIILPVLERLEPAFPGAKNPAAVNLLLGTAFHESLGGTYIKQIQGPALGIYQMEPATHDSLWDNYINYGEHRVSAIHGFTRHGNHGQLIYDLNYATAMARIAYYSESFPWCAPDDVMGLGEIWKEYYNTPLGAGTIEQFMEHYPL